MMLFANSLSYMSAPETKSALTSTGPLGALACARASNGYLRHRTEVTV